MEVIDHNFIYDKKNILLSFFTFDCLYDFNLRICGERGDSGSEVSSTIIDSRP